MRLLALDFCYISFITMVIVCRDSVRYLFEFFCEVAPGSEEKDPYMIRKYPEVYKNEQELKDLPKFTFPCPFEE